MNDVRSVTDNGTVTGFSSDRPLWLALVVFIGLLICLGVYATLTR